MRGIHVKDQATHARSVETLGRLTLRSRAGPPLARGQRRSLSGVPARGQTIPLGDPLGRQLSELVRDPLRVAAPSPRITVHGLPSHRSPRMTARTMTSGFGRTPRVLRRRRTARRAKPCADLPSSRRNPSVRSVRIPSVMWFSAKNSSRSIRPSTRSERSSTVSRRAGSNVADLGMQVCRMVFIDPSSRVRKGLPLCVGKLCRGPPRAKCTTVPPESARRAGRGNGATATSHPTQR